MRAPERQAIPAVEEFRRVLAELFPKIRTQPVSGEGNIAGTWRADKTVA